jgi:hypothetical protein
MLTLHYPNYVIEYGKVIAVEKGKELSSVVADVKLLERKSSGDVFRITYWEIDNESTKLVAKDFTCPATNITMLHSLVKKFLRPEFEKQARKVWRTDQIQFKEPNEG